ncbi:MAG: hypothetical protein IJ025_07755 [Clostridia bacterium]|nr:hypothetical protein [Clostridia bacterium]
MKKFSMLSALILACIIVLSSCSGVKQGNNDNTEKSTEAGEVSTTQKILTPEEKKHQEELEMAETLTEKMINSATAEEVAACVIESSDEFEKMILEQFTESDYQVEGTWLGEYKGAIVIAFDVTRESDPDYYYWGLQLFSYTDEGLLVNTDIDLQTEIDQNFSCVSCQGWGYTVEEPKTSGGKEEKIECPKCNGTGFNFSQEIK